MDIILRLRDPKIKRVDPPLASDIFSGNVENRRLKVVAAEKSLWYANEDGIK